MTSEPQPTPEPAEDGLATLQEACEAIENLSDADYAKLMLVADGLRRARLRVNTAEPEDLLQEAFAKTLDGTRAWNRSISMLKHLAEVMRSDWSHEAERRSKWPMRPLEVIPRDAEEEEVSAQPCARIRIAPGGAPRLPCQGLPTRNLPPWRPDMETRRSLLRIVAAYLAVGLAPLKGGVMRISPRPRRAQRGMLVEQRELEVLELFLPRRPQASTP